MIHVQRLFVAPGHSYYGRHGQAPAAYPIVEQTEVECVAGKGIRGDRFFGYRWNYKGQITFFAAEVFARMRSELALPPEFSPGQTRRNVITSGVDLNQLIGQEFEIQGVGFRGVEEARPCEWMNEAFRQDTAEQWLRGNGGLRARILTDGWLRISGPGPA